MTASVHVFTFKTGLLSRLAHDLRLRCGRFSVSVAEGTVEASFDPRSLRVDGVMRDGRLDRGGLSASDYAKIEATVRDEILRTRRHESIGFRGSLAAAGDGVRVGGQLTLLGRTRPVPPAVARRDGDAWVLELELVPTAWGIAPYRALGGTLKLQDRVRVRVALPLVEGLTASAGSNRWSGPST